MEQIARLSFAVVAAAVLGVTLADAPEAETHVVTATSRGSAWVYLDRRSGAGREESVRIFARPGDAVEFWRADGTDDVFFYVTPPGQSELGRRIDVFAGFEEAPGAPGLEPMPIQEGLAQEAYRSRASRDNPVHLTTIRIKEGLSRPIFFGSTEQTVGWGGRMHGVIMPRTLAGPRDLEPRTVDLPVALALAVADERTWDLGRLARRPDTTEVLRNGRLLSRSTEGEERASDVTDRWFETMPELAPDPDRAPWFAATSIDFPNPAEPWRTGYGRLDVVAAIGDPETDQWRWWRIKNGVLQGKPSFIERTPILPKDAAEQDLGFPLGTGPEALAAAVDVSANGQRELLLYPGPATGGLEIYRVVNQDLELSQVIPLDRVAGGSAPVSLAVWDVNSDGWADLLMGREQATPVLFLNDLSGRFSASLASELPGPLGPFESVSIKYVSPDGVPELSVRGLSAVYAAQRVAPATIELVPGGATSASPE